MKKLLLLLGLFVLPGIVWAHQFSTQTGIDDQTLTTTGVTGTGAGTSVAVSGVHPDAYAVSVIRTAGSTDVVEVDLECSQDNSAWAQMNTITTVAGGSNGAGNANRACNFIRYNVVTVGSGNTLTIIISAFHAG